MKPHPNPQGIVVLQIAKHSRSHFADIGDLRPGMPFRVPHHQGVRHVVTVVAMTDQTVTVRGNHPLAGDQFPVFSGHLALRSVDIVWADRQGIPLCTRRPSTAWTTGWDDCWSVAWRLAATSAECEEREESERSEHRRRWLRNNLAAVFNLAEGNNFVRIEPRPCLD